MQTLLVALAALASLFCVALARSRRVVQQCEQGLLVGRGRVVGLEEPGLVRLVPVISTVSWRSTCCTPDGCGALIHRRGPETTAAAGPPSSGCGH